MEPAAGPRPRRPRRGLRLAADGRPAGLELVPDVVVEVPREAEDVAEHVVGDHVRVEPAHVREQARVRHELREHVVLEARRGRLHPAEPPRRGEQPGRELAEEGVGVGDRRARLALVPGVDDGHGARRLDDLRETLRLDGRMDDELHAQGSFVGSGESGGGAAAGAAEPGGSTSKSSRRWAVRSASSTASGESARARMKPR